MYSKKFDSSIIDIVPLMLVHVVLHRNFAPDSGVAFSELHVLKYVFVHIIICYFELYSWNTIIELNLFSTLAVNTNILFTLRWNLSQNAYNHISRRVEQSY